MTTDIDERIVQFEKMAREDPDNDMAHFSLGSAYLKAGRHTEAAESFQRCIALNEGMSKAYQLAGEALVAAGDADRAGELLDAGYRVAAAKGDVMPRDAIAELLRSFGREPPETPAEAAGEAAGTGAFVCNRTGRPGTQLPEPPLRGPIGQWIYENISAETWRDWIGQGTKVINELRLDFSREQDQDVYEQHMCEYLGIDEALYRQLTGGR